MYVRVSKWNSSASTATTFIKFDVWRFFEILSRILNFHYNLTRITGTLHEDLCAFTITYRRILLRVWDISHKSCRENQNTFHVPTIFSPENPALYGVMWKNVVQPARSQTITENGVEYVWVSCRIVKALIIDNILLLYSNNCHAVVSQCYVIRTYIGWLLLLSFRSLSHRKHTKSQF